MDDAFLAFAERAYAPRRAAEAARLDARLFRARSGRAAVADAKRSMKRRCKAAREAVDEALRAHATSVGNLDPVAVATAYDRLAGPDQASCVNAVAGVAGRFADAPATMLGAQAAVARAFQNGRTDALRHLTEDARELLERQRDRSRPLPAVVVRRGAGLLFGGGAIWSAAGWLAWHWTSIQSSLQHVEQFLHH